jgi:hypothetical protein
MSLPRPCLPIRRNRNRKRRQRQPPSDGDDVEYQHDDTQTIISDHSTPMDISALESMDAMEYLASVKEQASSLPDVFISEQVQDETMVNDGGGANVELSMNGDGHAPIDGSAAARDYLFSHRLDILPPPTTMHVPPVQSLYSWKDSTLNNFSVLRLYMSTCCEELKRVTKANTMNTNVNTKSTKNGNHDRIKVPKSKDLYAWHVFCLGDEGRKEMESKMVSVQLSDMDYDANASEIDLELSKYNIPSEGYEPTTKLLSQFDQIIIRRLLSHHTQYVAAGCTMTVKRMKWLYAVLARLEKPLHRDELAY